MRSLWGLGPLSGRLWHSAKAIPYNFARLYLSRQKQSTTPRHSKPACAVVAQPRGIEAPAHAPAFAAHARPSVDQPGQLARVEVVAGCCVLVELEPGGFEPRDDRLGAAIGLDRMVEQTMQGFGHRVIHVAGHAIGAETDLLRLLLARGVALGVEDARRVADRGRARRHRLDHHRIGAHLGAVDRP